MHQLVRAPTFGTARRPADPAPSTKRLITPKELGPRKGIYYHPNWLRTMWQRGNFPAPVRISPHRIGWPEEAIDAWIAAKLGESVA